MSDSESVIIFVSNNCHMCERPWTVKFRLKGFLDDAENEVEEDELGPFFLCDEHFEQFKRESERPVIVQMIRKEVT